jgi:hypothetical protein
VTSFVLLTRLSFALLAAATTQTLHNRAVQKFNDAMFAEAAVLFQAELAKVSETDPPTAMELVAREKLVLSLYQSGDLAGARAAYRRLKSRFADFRWNPHEVTAETMAEIEGESERPVHIVRASPDGPASLPASAEAPRTLVKAQPSWHWSYLAPFGIGQFLAGSPVRGALLLAAELGFATMNLIGGLLLLAQTNPDGTMRNLRAGESAVIVMNVGFCGLMGALVAGVIDGALERN